MLEARSLSRKYGDRTVVDEVSFTVRPGRMTGFVGANGAGKTTVMRMLMGVLAATVKVNMPWSKANCPGQSQTVVSVFDRFRVIAMVHD